MHFAVGCALRGNPRNSRRDEGTSKPNETHSSLAMEEYNCIGDSIENARLYPNTYICPNPFGSQRFGLDKTGFLADWEGEEITWSPGVRGSYLSMQSDGNLVLYNDKDEPVWASDCLSGGVTRLTKPGYAGVSIQSVSDDVTVWMVHGNGQESSCFSTTEPQVKCQGNVLARGGNLAHNEYLCSPTSQFLHFGLNDRGQVAL